MAEISLTALKKERWSVMTAFLLITSAGASHLIASPIPSTGPFPCEGGKKIPCYFNTAFICNQEKVAAMYRFLN